MLPLGVIIAESSNETEKSNNRRTPCGLYRNCGHIIACGRWHVRFAVWKHRDRLQPIRKLSLLRRAIAPRCSWEKARAAAWNADRLRARLREHASRSDRGFLGYHARERRLSGSSSDLKDKRAAFQPECGPLFSIAALKHLDGMKRASDGDQNLIWAPAVKNWIGSWLECAPLSAVTSSSTCL